MMGSILPEVVAQVVILLRNDAAIINALTDADGNVKVFNNVPVGTVPPYLWVLSDTESDVPKKLGAGKYGRTCTIKVTPVSRHMGTKELDELGDLVMRCLERQPLTLSSEYREAGIVWDGDNRAPVAVVVEGVLQWTRDLMFRASAR